MLGSPTTLPCFLAGRAKVDERWVVGGARGGSSTVPPSFANDLPDWQRRPSAVECNPAGPWTRVGTWSGLQCSNRAHQNGGGCLLVGKLEWRLQSTDGRPNTMSSSSIDSLVENGGRVDTLPLFNRIAPKRLVCLNPVRLSPTTRITVVADWPSRQRGTLDFFQKPHHSGRP